MKNITLLSVNARYTHSNLAILYMRDILAGLNYNISILELTINTDKFKILANIIATNPDIIAISTYIWNAQVVEFLTENLKKLYPEKVLVLGGPEVSYNFEKWENLNFPPDYIIQGAGESGFRRLAESDFALEESIINIPNDNFINKSVPYTREDLDRIKLKYIYYEASRGCPFKCSFCLSSRSDQKLQYKQIDIVIKELTEILKSNPRIIKFVDRSFNANRVFARQVWQFISELEQETKFHFEVHPALLEDQDFEILEKIPPERIQFEIGVQSTNNKTLQAINRNYAFSSFKHKLTRLLNIKNIHTHLDLIAGLPYEDKTSYLNSINDLLELDADVIQLGFLKVLSGTEMHDKAEEYELVYDSETPYQILKNKWLTFEDIVYLHKFEDVFDAFYNSEKFKNTINEFKSCFARPVDLFIGLADCFSNLEEMSSYNLNKKFELFYSFLIETLGTAQENKISDFLSWDWILHSRKNNTPACLDHSQNLAYKNQVFDDLKTEAKQLWIDRLADKAKELKKCAFFVARSKEFSTKILNGKSKAIVFKDYIYF